jgi:hypothetical protein
MDSEVSSQDLRPPRGGIGFPLTPSLPGWAASSSSALRSSAPGICRRSLASASAVSESRGTFCPGAAFSPVGFMALRYLDVACASLGEATEGTIGEVTMAVSHPSGSRGVRRLKLTAAVFAEARVIGMTFPSAGRTGLGVARVPHRFSQFHTHDSGGDGDDPIAEDHQA